MGGHRARLLGQQTLWIIGVAICGLLRSADNGVAGKRLGCPGRNGAALLLRLPERRISTACRLIGDSAGNLYGTTNVGGSSYCFGGGCGTVFELSPPTTSGGTWAEKVLYSFTGGNDSGYLQAGLIADSAGNLYGTTYVGGASNNGTVFELTGMGFAVFAGTPGASNCHGQSVSALAKQYGGLDTAAAAFGYSSVAALQNAIAVYCGG